MANSRAEITACLSAVPTSEILHLLTDDTLRQMFNTLAARALNQTMARDTLSSPRSTPSPSTLARQKIKSKRPLNAFMAFRSYYVKMFPDAPQKTASGFLRTLWSQESFRNKWALIAKVYSFIRDELGKDKASLSEFLKHACPVMRILEPHQYLETLGWKIVSNEDGPSTLVQHSQTCSPEAIEKQRRTGPRTELELIQHIVQNGYLSDQAQLLIDRMRTTKNTIMTPGSSFISEMTSSDNGATATFQIGTPDTTQSLTPEAFDLLSPPPLTNSSYETQTGRAVETPTPPEIYHFSTSMPNGLSELTSVLPIHSLPSHQCLDIDDAWQVDGILGYDTPEGDRVLDFSTGTTYDPRDDFHYAF